ncbi:MAG: hypothetical protein BGO77_06760 [Caedibacter sp. 37-49]|nr:MAG: hypothetical protein BGO77_06760 [Caedibacter sp. 37-49]
MSELMLSKKPSVFKILDKLLQDKNLFSYSNDEPFSKQKKSSYIDLEASSTGKILLVSEFKSDQVPFVFPLKKLGYELFVVTTQQEALHLLSHETIDIIINSLEEPSQQLELIKNLKSQNQYAHIPLLVASSLQAQISQSLALGAEDFILPNLDSEVLDLRLKMWLKHRIYNTFQIKNLVEVKTRLSLLKQAVECVDEGFAIFDQQDELVLCNESFRYIYRLEDIEIIGGNTYQHLLETNYKRGIYLLNSRRALKQDILLDDKYQLWLSKRLKFHNTPRKPYIEKLSNGHFIEITEKKMAEGGTIAIYKDVTEQLQYENQIQYLATHDILTGLANRVLFKKALEDVLHQTKRKPLKFAVIYIDLDGFKSINDTFGHVYGDHLLIEVGKRLQHCLRKSDLIARLGGDEFSILTKKIKNRQALENLIIRIKESLCAPIKHGSEKMEIGASIGAFFGPVEEFTPTSLMLAADKAMYEAKRAGRNNYRITTS